MAVTALGTTFNTTTGTHTVVATPAVGDLIIIIAADSGFVGTTTPTDNNADGLGAYTLITSALKNTSADNLRVYVRNSLVGNASSTTFSQAAASSTGGGLTVLKVTGLSVAGLAAIRQSVAQANQAAAGTPAPVLANTPLSGNPIITAVFNGTSPATITQRTGYTEDTDSGYSTPTTGLEVSHLASGETSATLTYGGTSASAFSSVAIEVSLATPSTSAISLSDNFDDNSIDTTKWPGNFNGTGNSITEANGEAEITLSGTSGAYSEYAHTTPSYDFTNAHVFVMAKTVTADAATNAQCYMKVIKDGTNFVTIGKLGGNLQMQSQTGGVDSITTMAYNAATMKWWRIAFDASYVYWQISSDGVTWNNVRTLARPWVITVLTLSLGAGTFAAQASPGNFFFDNFNVAPQTLTSTQSATARIATNLTKTQSAIARIQETVTKTQSAVGRVAVNLTKTQSAISRIANTRTKTQPAVARIQNIVTKTQPAVARIANIKTKTQPAVARVANTLTKTQSATANIQPTTASTFTQTAKARIANTLTKTQSAVGRIAVNLTKTQSATARIANNRTKTQSAIARIATKPTKTQPAVARIAVNLTKTQSAKAAIKFVGLTKTQPAIARISNTKTKTQSAVARVANTKTKTQSATANIQPHTVYYVSAVGNDSNSGTDIAHPWLTITKVNAHTFAPNDQVLFRGGDTFSGKIVPGLGGSSGHPIVFGSYGTGRATISNAADSAILLYNIGYVEVHDLVFVGSSTAQGNGSTGFAIYNDTSVVYHSFLIDNCDVSLFTYGLSIGGINSASGYEGVTITNTAVHDNSDTGLLSYNQTAGFTAGVFPHSNFTLTHVTAYNNTGLASVTTRHTGDGVVLGCVDGAVMDYCVGYNNGANNGCTTEGPCGLWAYNSNNVTIKRSVTYDNKSGTAIDGNGFDLDINTSNSTIEYCLAYNNYGAGILVFGAANANNAGNVVRYNMVWGNAYNPLGSNLADIFVGGQISAISVYNNTVIARDTGGMTPTPVMVGGTPTGVTVRNNIIYSGTAPCINGLSTWTSSQVLFQGNDYYRPGGLSIKWGATTYITLASWRAAASGQEVVSAVNTGLIVDPQLVTPASAPTVTDPTILTGANGLRPQTTSPMLGAGRNLNSDFGTVIGSSDYFGAVPSSPFTIGAAQGFLGTKTQSAIAHIANSFTKTQPATARVATQQTKTQSATAKIAPAMVVKTQPATARIASRQSKTQPATARLLQNISGGLLLWNGTTWLPYPIKVWTGSAWVIKPLKKWDGAAWTLVA